MNEGRERDHSGLLRWRRGLALAVAFALLGSLFVMSPAPARAAVGDLYWSYCLSALSAPAPGCGGVINWKPDVVSKVVVSESGKYLYTLRTNGVSVFARNPANGALAYRGCLGPKLPGAPSINDGCVEVPSVVNPRDLVISKDEQSVYVSAGSGDVYGRSVLTVFRRDAADENFIRFAQCFRSVASEAAYPQCSAVGALDGPGGLLVTDDGGTLIASLGGFSKQRGGVGWFARDTATGNLTYRACLLSTTGEGGGGPCTYVDGIDGGSLAAGNAEASSLYVRGYNGTLIGLKRNIVSGEIAFDHCFRDQSLSSPAVCAPAPGLARGGSIGITGDGRDVYVTGRDTVTQFIRDAATGRLVYASCMHDVQTPTPNCPGQGIYFANPSGIDVSVDGRSVYVTGLDSDSVALFQRVPGGTGLNQTGCFLDIERTGLGCTKVQGLDLASGIDSTRDGRSVYVTSYGDGMAAFTRTPVPPFVGFAPGVTPPDTTIDAGPAPKSKQRKATFAFSSSEAGSMFECSLDGADPVSCTSPHTVTGLRPGSHLFRVVAIDADGNRDDSPASSGFQVKKKHHRKR